MWRKTRRRRLARIRSGLWDGHLVGSGTVPVSSDRPGEASSALRVGNRTLHGRHKSADFVGGPLSAGIVTRREIVGALRSAPVPRLTGLNWL